MALVAVAAMPLGAAAQTHVALIIDNDPPGSTAALPVTNDATSDPGGRVTSGAIASRLSALSYSVAHLDGLDAASMRQNLETFKAQSAKAEVAVLYFRGQAQERGGRNHLMGIAATSGADPGSQAVPLDDVVDAMKATRANVVLVDAGYYDAGVGQTERAPALVQVAERPGFLIVMATAPGKSLRGDGRMRFSRAVLGGLEQTTSDWSGFGSSLRRRVFEESRGEQVPYVRGTLRPGIRLAALPATPETVPNAPAPGVVPVVPRLAVPRPAQPQIAPPQQQIVPPPRQQAIPAPPRQQVVPPPQQVERTPPPRFREQQAAPPPPRIERAPPRIERAPRVREQQAAPPRIERAPPARAERAERSAPSRGNSPSSGGRISLPGAF